MSNIVGAYGASNQAMTITLASLASGAARQSSQIVVSGLSPVPLDILVFLKMKTGASETATYCTLYAAGSVDGGTTLTDGATTSDAAITLPSAPNSKLLGIINCPASATIYYAGPFSLARAFDGTLPANIVTILQNSTGVALDSTAGNFSMFYQTVYNQVV